MNLSLVKTATDEAADRLLAREARWLRELEEVRPLAGQVPRLIEEGTGPQGRRYLVVSIASVRAEGHCSLCHVHRKAETTKADEDDVPYGRTDAAGFYTPMAVLLNEGPVEHYRPVDVSHRQPFVSVTCAEGKAPRKVTRGGPVRFSCARITSLIAYSAAVR